MRFPFTRMITRLGAISLSLGVMFGLIALRPDAPTTVFAAAPTCSAVVKQALAQAAQVCTNLKRNQACYAGSPIESQAKPGVNGFVFNNPGDIINLGDAISIKTAPYNRKEGTWGVALLRVQANLPDTAVGQNVTMILFGDTEVTDAGGSKPMSAFYLRTGAGQPGCGAMPPNGMLLQTPKGGQKVELTANGVQLSIGSTVFLTSNVNANGNSNLWVYTIEGDVDVTSQGVTVDVPGGQQTCVKQTEFDPNNGLLQAIAPPCKPKNLNNNVVNPLPTDTLDEIAEQTPPPPPPSNNDPNPPPPDPTETPETVETPVATQEPIPE